MTFTRRTLPRPAPARVLACGAWLKNTACLLDGNTVWTSPVHGDLGEPANRAALLASVGHLQTLASGPIAAVAHDLHPDFFSTEVAVQLAQRLQVPAIAVQHHHAHIALMQAEQDLPSPVVGLALDGVGLGSDGVAWGGELLCVSGAQFERLDHLPELMLPGGDIAAREPWRMAAAVLHRLGRGHEIEQRLNVVSGWADTGNGVKTQHFKSIATVLSRSVHCPRTTSAGRWFDAVAGLLGVCLHQTEEAQAAIALEQLAALWLANNPAPTLPHEFVAAGLNLDVLMEHLLALCDTAPQESGARRALQSQAAALFHVALGHALAQAAITAAQQRHTPHVALGGGCFFNRVLRERVREHLVQAQLDVVLPHDLNCGDAGLALGQAWVAAHAVAAQSVSSTVSRESVCA